MECIEKDGKERSRHVGPPWTDDHGRGRPTSDWSWFRRARAPALECAEDLLEITLAQPTVHAVERTSGHACWEAWTDAIDGSQSF